MIEQPAIRLHLHLARELGFTGRQRMYAALTVAELAEWEALYEIDPWGVERDDLRIGVLASLTDACHRTSGRPEPPETYMPIIRRLRKTTSQTVESMKQTVKHIAAAFGRSRGKPRPAKVHHQHRRRRP